MTVEACGDAGAITARIVAPTGEKATELRVQTQGIADTAFVMSTLHNHVYGHHSNSPIVYWKPGRSPYTGVHDDPYNPNHERSYSRPGCDWRWF